MARELVICADKTPDPINRLRFILRAQGVLALAHAACNAEKSRLQVEEAMAAAKNVERLCFKTLGLGDSPDQDT
jgi:cell division protein FtsL